MDRYARIESVTFDGSALPLPLSVRIQRRGDALPAAGDGEAFATSVQTAPPSVTAEVRIRGVAAAEALALGRRGELAIVVTAARGDGASRTVRLSGAVLVAAEQAYEQSAMATALLRFVAEASGGGDPYHAEETL